MAFTYKNSFVGEGHLSFIYNKTYRISTIFQVLRSPTVPSRWLIHSTVYQMTVTYKESFEGDGHLTFNIRLNSPWKSEIDL
jgi:hypothetical protein